MKRQLKPEDIARFQRQLANGFLRQGQYGRYHERALRLSGDCGDDSENNKLAIETIRINELLSKAQWRKCLDIIRDKIGFVEKETGYFYGDVTRLGTTLQTAFALIGQSLVAESQTRWPSARRHTLQERLAALKFQESEYGVLTRLDHIPHLQQLVDRSEQNIPNMHSFVVSVISGTAEEMRGSHSCRCWPTNVKAVVKTRKSCVTLISLHIRLRDWRCWPAPEARLGSLCAGTVSCVKLNVASGGWMGDPLTLVD